MELEPCAGADLSGGQVFCRSPPPPPLGLVFSRLWWIRGKARPFQTAAIHHIRLWSVCFAFADHSVRSGEGREKKLLCSLGTSVKLACEPCRNGKCGRFRRGRFSVPQIKTRVPQSTSCQSRGGVLQADAGALIPMLLAFDATRLLQSRFHAAAAAAAAGS